MINQFKDSLTFYSRHNYLLNRQIAKLDKEEKMDPEQRRLLKEKKAIKMIRFAAENSPFYKELYAGIDLRGPFSEVYASLPEISKINIREKEETLLTSPVRMMKKAFTSGTSGSPLTLYRSAGSILKENAYVWQYRISKGLNIGDRHISMRGVLDNKTLKYFNSAENTLYLSSYLLSRSSVKKYVKLIQEFKPKSIVAFPSSLYTLVNLLEEEGLKLEVPILFTSSETLYPFQREKIEKILNGRIFDRYSTAERSILLHECDHGNFHEAPNYSYFEFKEKGVLTTAFINQAFPLIKYQIDDSFMFMDKSCACGQGIGVSSIEGRVDDVVLLEDGTRIGRLGVAFQGIPHLRYAQIIQEKRDGITVNLVTSPDFKVKDEELLLHKLRQRLNNTLSISFNKVEEKEIQKTKSGKFKLVVSKVA
jgi:phenylacetate-CoA ligase